MGPRRLQNCKHPFPVIYKMADGAHVGNWYILAFSWAFCQQYFSAIIKSQPPVCCIHAVDWSSHVTAAHALSVAAVSTKVSGGREGGNEWRIQNYTGWLKKSKLLMISQSQIVCFRWNLVRYGLRDHNKEWLIRLWVVSWCSSPKLSPFVVVSSIFTPGSKDSDA